MLSSLFSKPYSRLLILSDGAGWALDEEAEALLNITKGLGISSKRASRVIFNIPQVVHHTSQFALLYENTYKSKHRISIDYFHGKGEQSESLKACLEALRKHHADISRVRVSTREMEELIKTTSIDPNKVFRIPIGVNLEFFQPQTSEKKIEARKKLGIPEDAIVIGSFQKDGVGKGEGNEPKLIKGPDVFIKTIEKLKQDIPNLFILLSGPARGYVKNELDRLKIPYKHHYVDEYKKIGELYDALDLYIITSREEGGPKAMLESMVKGIPLVTTAVGQCRDLIVNGKNGMMAPIEDVEKLHALSLQVLTDEYLRTSITTQGFITAADNSYESQKPLWQKYFKDLISF